MIKNLFLPESVKGYYLFPVRILGFDVGKTTIKVTQISCKGREIIVEKCLEEPIQASNVLDYPERAAATIKVLLAQTQPYDAIISAMPSSQAIFKELKVPFTGLETIRKIIAYEVEPLLPFSVNDAVIDCIITKEIPEEKSSEVLIAAVQNQYVAQHISLFEMAGVQPERVTIDLFALYGLYRLIPAYANQPGGIVLFEIEHQTSRLAFIYNGQLRLIRSMPKGLMDQAQVVAKKLNITEQEAFEYIMRFGLEPGNNDAYAPAIRQAFSTFFNEIVFTLQSFTNLIKSSQSISKIIIFGQSATIKGLPELVTELSHITTEIFNIQGIAQNHLNIKAKQTIPQKNIVSFATALPSSTTVDFNLRQKEFALASDKTFLYQIITSAALFLFIIGMLLGNALWQGHKLKREAYQSEQEVIETLKERIPKIPADVATLDDALDNAKTIVNQEEKVWSPFSSSARSRFLEYLLELTSKIDKANLGLDVEKITILPDVINLKARVRGFDELTSLEKDLNQSKIFKVEPVHDPNFTTTGMSIHIKQKPGSRGK